MTDTFDAVLAEVDALAAKIASAGVNGFGNHVTYLRDRLAAAHAAEVAEARDWNERVSVCRDHTAEIVDGDCVVCALAERDARIAELQRGIVERGDDVIVPWQLYEEINRTGAEWKARAEAAERDAKELRDYAEHRVDCAHAAYLDAPCDCGLAELQAIATTEQADED